jgi:deoxycytidylate deaminase
MATQSPKKRVDFQSSKTNILGMHKFLKLAYDLALAHDFDKSMDYFHCAVIAKGGKVLSVGYNARGFHSFVECYKVKEHTCTIHAEIAAILAKRKKVRFEGSKVYVVRIRPNGTVAMSRPCEMCQQVLHNYGVKRAYFSTDEFPFVGKMKLDNPESSE